MVVVDGGGAGVEGEEADEGGEGSSQPRYTREWGYVYRPITTQTQQKS